MEPPCPQCGKDYVRRTRRDGLFEQVASVFYLYPFRCQLCMYRFRAFQWGTRYTRGPVDKREYERIPTWIPVTVSGEGVEGTGVVTDLSMAGCALQTSVRPDEGALLQLVLQLTDPAQTVTVEAAVVRSIRPAGLGLQFLRVGMEDKDRLSRHIQALGAAKRRGPA